MRFGLEYPMEDGAIVHDWFSAGALISFLEGVDFTPEELKKVRFFSIEKEQK